jgi:perosamine synthetase
MTNDVGNHDLPAILGGTPAVGISAPELAAACAWPHLGEEELSAIRRLFDDRNISTHGVIGELEAAYCELSGRRHGVAHCNGTTALMAAFWSLDLQPGDRVLVTSAAFWASVVPMMWLGLVPVFCETDPLTLSIDLTDAREKWTPQVKAMVIVPLWGVPPNYDALLDFAVEKNLRVVEDASHAHGATYRGKPCGSFGDVSVFSLQGDKLAPAGEGGILLTDDEVIRERVICLGDITRILRLDSPARRFAATSFGIKSRIAPVSAAIGLCQLRKLEQTNRIRAANLEPISRTFAKFGFDPFPDHADTRRVYFEYLVRWQQGPLDAAGWQRALAAEGCEVGTPRYPLLHQQPFFTEGQFQNILRLDESRLPDFSGVQLPRTEAFNGTLLKLPVFTCLAAEIVAAYQAAICKVGSNAERIAAFITRDKDCNIAPF